MRSRANCFTSAAALLTVSLGGCSAFQGTWRSLHNTDLVGESPPPLLGADWVMPDGAGAPSLEGRWRVVVFFLPG